MQAFDLPYELEVSRVALSKSLNAIAKEIRDAPGEVRLNYENGQLYIEAGHTSSGVPAKGTWPLPVFVQQTWILSLTRRLPPGDPIQLRVDAGRLYANLYSEPCSWMPRVTPVSIDVLTNEENLLIAEAAKILTLVHIKKSDLEELVLTNRARPQPHSARDKKMISIIAKAWQLLAPLGIETSDIKNLADNAVRNAWK